MEQEEFIIGGENGVTVRILQAHGYNAVCGLSATDTNSDYGTRRTSAVLDLIAKELRSRAVGLVTIDEARAAADITKNDKPLPPGAHAIRPVDVSAACLQLSQDITNEFTLNGLAADFEKHRADKLKHATSAGAKSGIEAVWHDFSVFATQNSITLEPIAKLELQGTLQQTDWKNPNKLINVLKKFFKDQQITLTHPQELALQEFCHHPGQRRTR